LEKIKNLRVNPLIKFIYIHYNLKMVYGQVEFATYQDCHISFR